VIANGTEGPDKVHVGAVGSNVVVSGLPAQLQVAGSEAVGGGGALTLRDRGDLSGPVLEGWSLVAADQRLGPRVSCREI
jgi:hypothetical protein